MNHRVVHDPATKRRNTKYIPLLTSQRHANTTKAKITQPLSFHDHLALMVTTVPTPRGVNSPTSLILCPKDIIPRVGRTDISNTPIPWSTFLLSPISNEHIYLSIYLSINQSIHFHGGALSLLSGSSVQRVDSAAFSFSIPNLHSLQHLFGHQPWQQSPSHPLTPCNHTFVLALQTARASPSKFSQACLRRERERMGELTQLSSDPLRGSLDFRRRAVLASPFFSIKT
jgi:hypothetical protein